LNGALPRQAAQAAQAAHAVAGEAAKHGLESCRKIEDHPLGIKAKIST
jgi:hypothetical protein